MYQLKTYFLDLITNRVLLCAIIAWMTAQIIKVFTTSIYRKEFSLRQLLVGSGGMPSSHSAVVMATDISCGLLYGFDTPIFAVAAVLAVVVMRDAAGVRREAGKQAAMISRVSQELSRTRTNFVTDVLQELLGHTPLQVLFGALLGVAMAFLCQCWLFNLFLPAS